MSWVADMTIHRAAILRSPNVVTTGPGVHLERDLWVDAPPS